MFYTLRRKNYLKGEIEKIDKMIWKAEIKEQAAREVIGRTDKAMKEKQEKFDDLGECLENEKKKEKLDRKKIEKIIGERGKLEKEIKEMEDKKGKYVIELQRLENEQEGARQYQEIIRKVIG